MQSIQRGGSLTTYNLSHYNACQEWGIPYDACSNTTTNNNNNLSYKESKLSWFALLFDLSNNCKIWGSKECSLSNQHLTHKQY